MKCSYNECILERFENNDKCIFHCEKNKQNGWIIGENTKNKDSYPRNIYVWDTSKVNLFWKKIKQIIRISSKGKKSNLPSLMQTITMMKESDDKLKLYFNFDSFNVPPLNYNILENTDNEYGKCVFLKCSFNDNFILISNESKNEKSFSYDFHNCTFENDLSYYRFNEEAENINISNCKIKNDLNIDGNVNKININSLNSLNIKIGNFVYSKININEINIFQSTFKSLIISKYKSIDSLSIRDLGSFPDSRICISDTSLNKVYCQDIQINKIDLNNLIFSENSNINFENIDTDKLIIERIYQDSKSITLNHIIVNQNFICKRVDFKNTKFNDFNIANANKEIEKVSFNDASLNSIEWGNINEIKAEKDIFRQLKFLNDKQGNHMEANNFYSMEMKKHKIKLANYSWLSNCFQEKFIFFLNEKISNFGQSWLRPSMLMILFTILFYCGLHFNIQLVNSFKDINWYFIINDMLKFSNPFNKSVSEEYGLFYWAWLLHKFLMTVLIYHFIIAIKRKTKR